MSLAIHAEHVLRAEGTVWRYTIDIDREQVACQVTEAMAIDVIQDRAAVPPVHGRARLAEARESATRLSARLGRHELILTEGWTPASKQPYATCSCGHWSDAGELLSRRYQDRDSARRSIAVNRHGKHVKVSVPVAV